MQVGGDRARGALLRYVVIALAERCYGWLGGNRAVGAGHARDNHRGNRAHGALPQRVNRGRTEVFENLGLALSITGDLAGICAWFRRLRSCQPERMKVRALLRMLRDDGWKEVACRGSHRQLKHPDKPGRVTVPGKPSDDLARGTLNSILKQAGLRTG